MILKVSYDKIFDCRIQVCISIINSEDYPTSYVFDSGKSRFASEIFFSGREAMLWAEDQIQMLRKHLEEWRKTEVPEKHTYII